MSNNTIIDFFLAGTNSPEVQETIKELKPEDKLHFKSNEEFVAGELNYSPKAEVKIYTKDDKFCGYLPKRLLPYVNIDGDVIVQRRVESLDDLNFTALVVTTLNSAVLKEWLLKEAEKIEPEEFKALVENSNETNTQIEQGNVIKSIPYDKKVIDRNKIVIGKREVTLHDKVYLITTTIEPLDIEETFL